MTPLAPDLLRSKEFRPPSRRPGGLRGQHDANDQAWFPRRRRRRGAGASAPSPRRGPRNTTVGFIYVGSKDDYGWNQSHAVAAAALKDIPGITVVEEENVPETDAVAKTMESMINLDGATLIFPTSFGYFSPFMVDEAKKFPNVEFRHPTGLWKKGKDPDNAGGYYSYMDQGHYVNGDRRRVFRPRPTRSATSPQSRSASSCATSTRSPSA